MKNIIAHVAGTVLFLTVLIGGVGSIIKASNDGMQTAIANCRAGDHSFCAGGNHYFIPSLAQQIGQ